MLIESTYKLKINLSKFLPLSTGGGGRGNQGPVHPEWSGKMFVLFRLMREMRKPGNGGDKIVIISNYMDRFHK